MADPTSDQPIRDQPIRDDPSRDVSIQDDPIGSADHAASGPAGGSLASADGSANEVVLLCAGVRKYYPIKGGALKRRIGEVKAVDGVDLRIERGEVQGVVGESGCGKSTLARLLVALDEPTDGHVYFDVPADDAATIERLEGLDDPTGEEAGRLEALRDRYAVHRLSGERAAHYRRNVQFVFQNPTASLNPRHLVRKTVEEPLEVQTELSAAEREARVAELLEVVGLGPELMYRYPHMLSGGQKQRVAVARAIAVNPEFVVLDEPTSALDVSVQAQLLTLLQDLQDEFGLTYLFITHDLGVVRHMATDVAVMYLGKVVENAAREALFERPKHPYTEALISSSPAMEEAEGVHLEGDVPDPEDPPTGCYFHTRCHRAEAFCGWSGRDLVAHLERVAESDADARAFHGALEETTLDGYEATFAFDDSVEPARAERVLAGEDDLLRPAGEPLFEAVEGTSRDGRRVTVSFVDVETPALLEDDPGHRVACHLYTPEYQ